MNIKSSPFLLAALVLLLANPILAKSFGDYNNAVYIRNYDGDTITFNLPGLALSHILK